MFKMVSKLQNLAIEPPSLSSLVGILVCTRYRKLVYARARQVIQRGKGVHGDVADGVDQPGDDVDDGGRCQGGSVFPISSFKIVFLLFIGICVCICICAPTVAFTKMGTLQLLEQM